MRVGIFFGGPFVKSDAVAGRAGGGPGEGNGVPVPLGGCVAGEAVCALGGGGGAAGFTSSGGACVRVSLTHVSRKAMLRRTFLLTQRPNSLSK